MTFIADACDRVAEGYSLRQEQACAWVAAGCAHRYQHLLALAWGRGCVCMGGAVLVILGAAAVMQ